MTANVFKTLSPVTFLLALLISGAAYAEFLPLDENDAPAYRSDEAPAAAPRRRRPQPTQTEDGKPVSEFERQKAAVEKYLDQAKSNGRGAVAPSRTFGERRGSRYNSETGFSDAPAAKSATRGFQSDSPTPPSRYSKEQARAMKVLEQEYPVPVDSSRRATRAFQEDAPSQDAPRKQRWRVEAPAWNTPTPKAKAEVSPNYPFDSVERGPASNFAGAFDKKPNQSRQALLNVKKWMRGDSETTARRDSDSEDDDSAPTDFSARIGLLGGMSSLKSDSTTAGSSDAPANIYLGLMADVNLGQYFGVEVDGFYGVAPSVTEVTQDASGTTTSETKRSAQHLGAMVDLKLRYPIALGSFSVVPKFGIGYGLLSVTAKATSTTDDRAFRQNVSGLFWTAGLDIIPSETFSLGIDYAAALNASGSGTESVNGTDGSKAIEGAGFNRFRVGVYVKIAPKFSLGAQYILRNLTSGSAAAAAASGNLSKGNEALSQFLGVLMVTL